MHILILGINYLPEMVGIGPYTAGMAQSLVQAGHQVTVICAKPYYPEWKVDQSYQGAGRIISKEHGVRVIRLSTYVPENPSGTKRLAHHASFAARAHFAMRSEIRLKRPDIVMGIAPSLISTIVARDAARRTGAKLWLHIQDFEVEAAFATGLLKDGGLLARAARHFEKWAIKADLVSTISPQMCVKLEEKGVPPNQVVEFRNWASIDEIVPLDRPSSYRRKWKINRPYVALYSGNIANKQGIGIIIDAAKILADRKDLIFVVCGNGPILDSLKKQSIGLDNIVFQNLQPRECLSELLGLATVHLLPQLSGAADLVLPSKLANMLASGRPVIATAEPGTGIANEVAECGIIVPPENAVEFANAILKTIDSDDLKRQYSTNARARALKRWGRNEIIEKFILKVENFSRV